MRNSREEQSDGRTETVMKKTPGSGDMTVTLSGDPLKTMLF
jgi:hypothetical protein